MCFLPLVPFQLGKLVSRAKPLMPSDAPGFAQLFKKLPQLTCQPLQDASTGKKTEVALQSQALDIQFRHCPGCPAG